MSIFDYLQYTAYFYIYIFFSMASGGKLWLNFGTNQFIELKYEYYG